MRDSSESALNGIERIPKDYGMNRLLDIIAIDSS